MRGGGVVWLIVAHVVTLDFSFGGRRRTRSCDIHSSPPGYHGRTISLARWVANHVGIRMKHM